MKRFLFILFCFSSVYLFSQDSLHFISKDEALNIAKKHGRLRASSFSENMLSWNLIKPQLDSLNKTWIIGSNKLSYRNWGGTHDSDHRRPCRRVNGCHVIKTRRVWIDAINGKVLKREKKKKVSGNYE